MPSQITLADIAHRLGLERPPGGDRPIKGLATLLDAGPDELSFLGSEKFLREFAVTRAAAVLVAHKVKLRSPPPVPVLLVDDADLAVGKALELFAPPIPRPAVGQDATALVSPTATLGAGCRIGRHVSVGERSSLGRNVVLHTNVIVGDDVQIGDDCEVFPNVVIRERVQIGNRVVINAGSVIGTDGFGYRWDGKRHVKIPQIGQVIIEDDVEIGSCVCIDRAKFSTTRVGRGTKIDNLVQIAHNVQIGPHCVIVAQVGIAGSSTLGTGVVLGGQVAVRDHMKIGDGAFAAACTGVAEDVEAHTMVSGTPAIPHRQSLREQAALRRLPELVTQVRKLTEAVRVLKEGGQKG